MKGIAGSDGNSIYKGLRVTDFRASLHLMNASETPDQFMKRCQRMSDNLVERGFATKAVFNDSTQVFTVQWTKKGTTLHSLVGDLFRNFTGPGQELNGADLIAMLLLILKTGDNK